MPTDITITDFINHSTINATSIGTASYISSPSGYIANVYNYGTISGYLSFGSHDRNATNIINYGTINGIVTWTRGTGSKPITIDNYGIINYIANGNYSVGYHIGASTELQIKHYAMTITQNSTAFNTFSGTGNNSHILVESSSSVSFADKDSKLILDFSGDFELGVEYLLNMLVIHSYNFDAATRSALDVDLSRLTPQNDIYAITQSGTNGFKVELAPQYSTIGTLYKSNVHTMNNFTAISESMIYPHKYKGVNRGGVKKRVIRRVKKVGSLFDTPDSSLRDEPLGSAWQSKYFSSLRESTPLRHSDRSALARSEESKRFISESMDLGESVDFSLDSSLISFDQNDDSVWIASRSVNVRNDEFFYKNESLLLADAQSERARRTRISTQSISTNQNRTSTNDKYYFVLTPFANHNYFFESGNYNLSGLEYGFVMAFSGKINNSNALGAHFTMSYGSLNDANSKDFHISNINLNVGLNYKVDLVWDMFVKARGDFYYFLNTLRNLRLPQTKANNLGFGASVAYGKDFNFGNGGILGLSLGLDYKGLSANTISIHSSTFEKQLYNLLYLDLAMDYSKYFHSSVGLWGINTRLGIKGNVTNNALAKSKVILNTRTIDMTLDSDKVLGYANVGFSYLLQSKTFDMEFSLSYYGNYGDRIMSNGGGFEWRVGW